MNTTIMTGIETLTDRKLYEKCKLYGANARAWAKKFAALLLEVDRRELYKKYGFYSIFEFAAKLAGIGRETVVEILRVARKLEDKPLLKAQMETEGWGKLKVVANVATRENQKILAEKVREMSKATLVTFINELRKQNHELVQNRTGSADAGVAEQDSLLAEAIISDSSTEELYATPRISVRMPLKPETELRLRQLQKKLSHQAKAPVDFNEVIETLLDTYEKYQSKNLSPSIIAPSARRGQETSASICTIAPASNNNAPPSRYIPTAIKNFLSEKFVGRCAYHGCQKLPSIFHHTRRFALNSSHDPNFLMPLCKEHERLAHLGLIKNEEQAPGNWRLRPFPDRLSPKYAIDGMVNRFRMKKTIT